MNPDEEIAALEAELAQLEAEINPNKPFNPAEFYSDRANLVPHINPGAIARTGGEIIGGGIGGIVGGLGGGAAGAAGAPVVGGVTGAGTGYAIGGIPGAIMGGMTGAGAGLAFGAPAGAITGAATGSGLGAHYGRQFGDWINSALGLDTLSKEEQPSLGLDLGLGLVGEAAAVGRPLFNQAKIGARNTYQWAKNRVNPTSMAPEFVADPQVELARRIAERQSGDKLISEIGQELPTVVSREERAQLETIAELAKQTAVISNPSQINPITSMLGGATSKAAASVGAAENFERALPVLNKIGFWNRFSSLNEAVEGVVEPKAGMMTQVNTKRAEALTELEQGLQNIVKVTPDTELPKGAIVASSFNTAVSEMRDRISALANIGLLGDKAAGISKQVDDLHRYIQVAGARNGFRPSGAYSGEYLTPSQAVEFYQLLNEARRTVMDEFVVQRMGREATGQVVPMAQQEGAIEAIRNIQNGLRNAISNSVDQIVQANPGMKTTAETFNQLNEVQSGLNGFLDIVSLLKFEQARGSPLSSVAPGALVQPGGVSPYAASIGGGKAGIGAAGVKFITGSPQEISKGTSQQMYAATSGDRIWKNIQDMVSLSKTGVNLGPVPQFPLGGAYKSPGWERFAAGGVAGQLGYDALTPGNAQAQEELFQPQQPVKVSINPVLPEPKQGFQVPRNLSMLDTQGVANMIGVLMPPQIAEPLLIQWRKVSQGGTKEQQAEFLGLLVDRYPDFPIQRGPITGLNSEFDIGDGQMRLFSFNDKIKWEEQVNNSPLEVDEKAQRIMSLRKSGVVVPMNTKLAPVAPPKLQPEDRAMDYLMQTYEFQPRERTSTGSRRVE